MSAEDTLVEAPVLDPRELNKLAEFAEMGGLGLAEALVDVVAEQPDQLMFLTHDKLVILRDMGDILVASCEGVVGWVRRKDVKLDQALGLGDPTLLAVAHPTKDAGNPGSTAHVAELKTIVVSPSPPPHIALLPEPEMDSVSTTGHGPDLGDSGLLSNSPSASHRADQTSPVSSELSVGRPGTIDLQRISNQFDLDSPLHTPSSTAAGPGSRSEHSDHTFTPIMSTDGERPTDLAEQVETVEETNGDVEEERDLGRTKVRESMASIQSDTSSALGGIGGLLLAGAAQGIMDSDMTGEKIRLMSDTPSPPLVYSLGSNEPFAHSASFPPTTAESSTFAAAQRAAMQNNTVSTSSPSAAPTSPSVHDQAPLTSPTSPTSIMSFKSAQSNHTASSWDIAETYSRDSMYVRPDQVGWKVSKSPPPVVPSLPTGEGSRRLQGEHERSNLSKNILPDVEPGQAGDAGVLPPRLELPDEEMEREPTARGSTMDPPTPTSAASLQPARQGRSIASQIFSSTNKRDSALPTSASSGSTGGTASKGKGPRRSEVMSFASIFSDNSFDDEGRAFEGARKALERAGRGGMWAGEGIEEELEDEEERVQAEDADATDAPPPRPPRRRETGGVNEEDSSVRSSIDGESAITPIATSATGTVTPKATTSDCTFLDRTPSARTAPGPPSFDPSHTTAPPIPISTAAQSLADALCESENQDRSHRVSVGTAASIEGLPGLNLGLEAPIGQLRLANPDEGESDSDVSPVVGKGAGPHSLARLATADETAETVLNGRDRSTSTVDRFPPAFTPSTSAPPSSFGHDREIEETDTPVSCKILTPHTGSEAHGHAMFNGRSASPGPGQMTPLSMSRDPSSQTGLSMGSLGGNEGVGKGQMLGSPFPAALSADNIASIAESQAAIPIVAESPLPSPSLMSMPPRKASNAGLPSLNDQRRPSADRGLSPVPGGLGIPPRSPLVPQSGDSVSTPPLSSQQWTPTIGGASPAANANTKTGSPHSVTATRQAVEIARNTPPATRGQRAVTLTLVGQTSSELAASRGPVPITFTIGDPTQVHILREGARFRDGASPTSAFGSSPGIGLGLPSSFGSSSPMSGRMSPSAPGLSNESDRRPSSPLIPDSSDHKPRDYAVGLGLAPPFMEDTALALKSAPSPYPQMGSPIVGNGIGFGIGIGGPGTGTGSGAAGMAMGGIGPNSPRGTGQMRSATLPNMGPGAGGARASPFLTSHAHGPTDISQTTTVGEFGQRVNAGYPSPLAAAANGEVRDEKAEGPNEVAQAPQSPLPLPLVQTAATNGPAMTPQPAAGQGNPRITMLSQLAAQASQAPLPKLAENADRPTNSSETASTKTKTGLFQRQRSRSFSAAVNKAFGRKSGTGLTIDTSHAVPAVPVQPIVAGPLSALPTPMKDNSDPRASTPAVADNDGASKALANGLGKRPAFARQSSLPNTATPTEHAASLAAAARAAPLPPINTDVSHVHSDAGRASPRPHNGNAPSPRATADQNGASTDMARQGSHTMPPVVVPESIRSVSPVSITVSPTASVGPRAGSTSAAHRPGFANGHNPTARSGSATGSGTFSFRRPSAKGSKTSLGPGIEVTSTPTGRNSPLPMHSPISHKDFIQKDDTHTVKADGLAFEMIQPKRSLPPHHQSGSSPASIHTDLSLSPQKQNSTHLMSPSLASSTLHPPPGASVETISVHGHAFSMGSPGASAGGGYQDELERKRTINTVGSISGHSESGRSGKSTRTLPETDEWGFVLSKGTTPDIFLGRAAGAEQRASEQKWLSIINSPLNGAPAKRVRKLVIEHGVPASLRGKVWAWFMAGHMTARRPGTYHELLDHWRGGVELGQKIDHDVESAFPDHSIYSTTSTGQSDLRAILRAYSHFASGGYRSEMALVAGMLLIHCVAEDAFWLFAGFINGVLRDYYTAPPIAPSLPGQPLVQGQGPKREEARGDGDAPGTGQGQGQGQGLAQRKEGVSLGMKVDAGVFTGVLWGSEPRIGRLFKDLGVHPILFLNKWWTQLFLRCLPWPTALRVIDAVVAEGPRFLIIAALAILTVSKERLLALPKSAKAIVAYLNDLPQDALLLPDSFMKACENVKFREEDYKKLRAGVEKEVLAGMGAGAGAGNVGLSVQVQGKVQNKV